MAVDCALTAVLSVGAVPIVGWWAIIIGALPYAFRLAQRASPRCVRRCHRGARAR